MKFNYFLNIENLYKNQYSASKPLVIRFDAVGITKNSYVNMAKDDDGYFADALKKTAKYFSEEYYCIAYAYTDEISLIVNPNTLMERFKCKDIQKANSILSQEFYREFHKHLIGNDLENVFFDCRIFSIPHKKICSYITYRVKSGQNVMTIYFAKRYYDLETYSRKKSEIEVEMIDFTQFKERNSYQKQGYLLFNGLEVKGDYLSLTECDDFKRKVNILNLDMHFKGNLDDKVNLNYSNITREELELDLNHEFEDLSFNKSPINDNCTLEDELEVDFSDFLDSF
ncbi:MAG: tRNA(His) guanylyltransferase Thg1 family protein [Peptostreptococcaceae bacterium]